MRVIPHITVGQAATVINACIAVVHQTSGLALVVLLIYVLRSVNPAINWSSITRKLHSSFWPTLLRTDSSTSPSSNAGIRFVSALTLLFAILLAAAGIITPLGLKNGPILLSDSHATSASYVADTSPIGQATPPRDSYFYSRSCGFSAPIPCPGNGADVNTTAIAPSIIETFTSTPYGPFSMQFRRYYEGVVDSNYANQPFILSPTSLTQSFILSDNIIVIGGAIVDLTRNTGIGLWNHTIPTASMGGVWSEEVMWLEPVTSCVSTNLTFDYVIEDVAFGYNLQSGVYASVPEWNLTDRGGFTNFNGEISRYPQDGQNIDLSAHAHVAAVVSTGYLMESLGNLTANESYIGKTYPFNRNSSTALAGAMRFLTLDGLLPQNFTLHTTSLSPLSIISLLCQNFGGEDTVNITNIAIRCGMLLGPPQRTDGGDTRFPSVHSAWTQGLYMCASATRVKMQNVTFSFNGTSDLSDVSVTRQDTNATPGLWAMENTNFRIKDIDVFWGRVDDSYENDSSLSTIRSEAFYIPAGESDLLKFGVATPGQPTTVVGAVWGTVYEAPPTFDYSGTTNFALLTKWQSAIQADPVNGVAQICNQIWTDLAANNLMGNHSATTVLFSRYEPSVAFNYRYGVPAFLLLLLWVPTFFVSAFALVIGQVKLSHIRFILNQTSVGRIVTGDSALKVVGPTGSGGMGLQVPPTTPMQQSQTRDVGTAEWSKTTGRTLLAFVGSGNQAEREGAPLLTPGSEIEKQLGGNDRVLEQKRLTSVLAEMIG